MKFVEQLKDIIEDETNIRPLTRNENSDVIFNRCGGIKMTDLFNTIKMTDLFNTSDILTTITAIQAKIKSTGYFGDTLSDLVTAISEHKIKTLTDIDQSKAFCFGTNDNHQYILFLPIDKVKKTHSYRPIANIDELLELLVPDLDVSDVCDSTGNDDEIIRYKKAELLLGKKITIREKQGTHTSVVIIQSVDFYGDSDSGADIYINNNPLNFMFDAYKILIDGEFVPFGVKE